MLKFQLLIKGELKMKNVMILSGAGLSAESGLKTFRDNGGLWEQHDLMEVCSATGFAKNPSKVLDFYDERRAQLKEVVPNKAHEVIAKLKDTYKDNLFVVTQNVDDLLERAGCKEIIHLHGFLPELRCLECENIFNIGYESYKDKSCPKCDSKHIRHNIIMFEEQAPAYNTLHKLLEQTHLFIAIGTSGTVLPVHCYARMCEQSILNGLDIAELRSCFDKAYEENASTAILKISEDIREFLGA